MWRFAIVVLLAACMHAQVARAAMRCAESLHVDFIGSVGSGAGWYDGADGGGDSGLAYGPIAAIALTRAGYGVDEGFGSDALEVGSLGLPRPFGCDYVVMTAGDYDVLIGGTGVVTEMQRLADLGVAALIGLVFIGAFALGYRFANRAGDV